MELERKYGIAQIVYRAILREEGIRFFPKQVEKEIAKIVRLTSNPVVSRDEVRGFLAEEYASVIYGKLQIARVVTGTTPSSIDLAGQIALACLKKRLNDKSKEHGIKFDEEDFKKQIGNAHKLTRIPEAALREFFVDMICEFFQGLKS